VLYAVAFIFHVQISEMFVLKQRFHDNICEIIAILLILISQNTFSLFKQNLFS